MGTFLICRFADKRDTCRRCVPVCQQSGMSPLPPPGTTAAKIHQIRSSALNLAHERRPVAYSAAMHTPRSSWLVAALIVSSAVTAAPIDRHALVTRHNPGITAVDKSAPFMVGNGNFAFTADITGLQTFQEQYSPLVPLLTQAQWAWHSFPNPKGFKLEQAMKPVEVHGKKRQYPALFDLGRSEAGTHPVAAREPAQVFAGSPGAAAARRPHGKAATFADLSATRQTLDLWSGRLDQQLHVRRRRRGGRDLRASRPRLLIVRLTSPLLSDGRLGVDLKFPGVSHKLNPDPADWEHPEAHSTQELTRGPGGLTLTRDARRHALFGEASPPIANSTSKRRRRTRIG